VAAAFFNPFAGNTPIVDCSGRLFHYSDPGIASASILRHSRTRKFARGSRRSRRDVWRQRQI